MGVFHSFTKMSHVSICSLISQLFLYLLLLLLFPSLQQLQHRQLRPQLHPFLQHHLLHQVVVLVCLHLLPLPRHHLLVAEEMVEEVDPLQLK